MSGRLLDNILTISIPLIILIHLNIAPFTKVEESFNIQAIHDIQAYGLPFSFLSRGGKNDTANASSPSPIGQYDHLDFPGSVPRTFVGAVIVALTSSPLAKYCAFPLARQLVVRAILGLFNALALLRLRKAVATAYGRAAGNWFVLLQASQFHVMYYASRTLPNTYAFALTTLALSSYILATNNPSPSPTSKRHHTISLFLLTVAGIIFRAEIAVLLATQTLYILFTRRASLTESVIPAGLLSVPLALALTVSVDSVFWQHWPTWPEWTGFYYNTIQGQASNWGVSPWYYYASNALPKLLLASGLLIPLALVNPSLRPRVLPLLIPSTLFVALYSFLPHKEWRFILYTVPAYTTVAATAASWIWTRRVKSVLYKLASLLLVGLVVVNLATSAASLLISSLNYPGGAAVLRLQNHLWSSNITANVFADNLVCQTGLTRYLENRPPAAAATEADLENVEPMAYATKSTASSASTLHFTKSEDQSQLLDPIFWSGFDYVLAEDPARCIGAWQILDVVYGFAGVELVRPGDDRSTSSTDSTPHSTEEVEQAEATNLGKSLYLPLPLLDRFEGIGRALTRGWWVRVKLAPRVHILGREVAGHDDVKTAS